MITGLKFFMFMTKAAVLRIIGAWYIVIMQIDMFK